MKKQTTLVVALALLFIVIQYLLRIPYYQYLLGPTFRLQGNIQNVLDVFCIIAYLIVDLITVISGALALSHSDVIQKEKAYVWFRYMFVVISLFSLVFDLYYFYLSGRYIFHNLFHGIVRIVLFPGQIALVVFLIRNKPERAVQRVNLQHYDMVTYTPKSQRFVHYLLDFIFIIPVWLNIILVFVNMGLYGHNQVLLELGAEVMIGIAFIFYYFISEAIFSQTFGKMVTKSCVVTNGVEFTGGRMFIRSLCRLIPFDKFSFLFGANWHDRASSTAVVYVDSWEKAFDDKPNSEQA